MTARILIVEDEGIIALSIEATLLDRGYQVVDIVDSGAEAIARTEALRPDLVLMDILLQGDINGLVAGEEIQSRLGVPIVYLTAFNVEDKVKSNAVSYTGYVRKPVNPDQIDGIIQQILNQRLQNQFSSTSTNF